MTKGDAVMGDREMIERARGLAASCDASGLVGTGAVIAALADRLEALSSEGRGDLERAEYRVGDFIGRHPVLCIHGHIDMNNLCPKCEAGEPAMSQPSPANQGEAVARVVSAHGDPEAFGEREIEVLCDLSKIPYNTHLYASPALAEPEGWVMVPREPTEEMIDAAVKASGDGMGMIGAAVRQCFARDYRAMLSALPPAPEGPAE